MLISLFIRSPNYFEVGVFWFFDLAKWKMVFVGNLRLVAMVTMQSSELCIFYILELSLVILFTATTLNMVDQAQMLSIIKFFTFVT